MLGLVHGAEFEDAEGFAGFASAGASIKYWAGGVVFKLKSDIDKERTEEQETEDGDEDVDESADEAF